MPDHRIKLFTQDSTNPQAGTISDLGRAILELFEDEFAKQFRNNERPDTKEEPCSSSVTAEFIPDGKKYEVKLKVASKLAAKRPIKMGFYVRGEGEDMSLVEFSRLQRELEFGEPI